MSSLIEMCLPIAIYAGIISAAVAFGKRLGGKVGGTLFAFLGSLFASSLFEIIIFCLPEGSFETNFLAGYFLVSFATVGGLLDLIFGEIYSSMPIWVHVIIVMITFGVIGFLTWQFKKETD